MDFDEIVKIVWNEPSLKEDDYYTTCVFSYMCGRFPDLTIKTCFEVVDQIRLMILMEDRP